MIKLPDETPEALFEFCDRIYDDRSRAAHVATDLWELCLAEVQRLNATAQPVSDRWIFEACENEPCQSGAIVNVHSAYIHLCAACSSDKKYSRMKITALPKRLSLPLPAAPGGQDD